jgi:dTDP-glucose 4,6-dehydratase
MQPQKKILVTGGLGFIGSNYLNKFVPHYPQYQFINVDASTYAARPDNIEVASYSNYAFEKADIRNTAELTEIFKKYHPTHVIHFAAESHVDISIENPGIFVETNIVGTHNLLALAKQFGIKRFHQISTDEVYGSLSASDPAFRTITPLSPNSPYSASKAAADLLVKSYAHTYDLDTVITRSSNTYGPRQDATKLIPKFIQNLLQGKKVPLYARGEHIRDWIYVEDNIDAIDLVFHKGKNGEVYNIGGGCEMTNKQITEKLLSLTGKSADSIEYVADRPGHDFRYAIDISELKEMLGWTARHSFTEGIQKTFHYYSTLTVVN